MEGWQIVLGLIAIGLIFAFAEWVILGATIVALLAAFSAGASAPTYAGILVVAFFAYGFFSNARDGILQDRAGDSEQQRIQAHFHRRQREDSFR